ncbi:MAG: hypothetical protein ACJA1E_002007 [Paracoccaceae bacterium]|jgi:hypothetical protein
MQPLYCTAADIWWGWMWFGFSNARCLIFNFPQPLSCFFEQTVFLSKVGQAHFQTRRGLTHRGTCLPASKNTVDQQK